MRKGGKNQNLNYHILSVDTDGHAVVSVDVPVRDFRGVHRHFYPPETAENRWRIRHFKEVKGKKDDRNKYLCEYLERLSDAKRKFDIVIQYYPNQNKRELWNLVDYALKNYDELIIDATLYHNYKHKMNLSNAQASVITDGEITEKINELKTKLNEEKQKKDIDKDFGLIRKYEKELEQWQGRWVLVMIADNYLACKRRKADLPCKGQWRI